MAKNKQQFTPGSKLVHRRHGKVIARATVGDDGAIKYAGKVFSSLSAAGSAAAKRLKMHASVNGRTFWRLATAAVLLIAVLGGSGCSRPSTPRPSCEFTIDAEAGAAGDLGATCRRDEVQWLTQVTAGVTAGTTIEIIVNHEQHAPGDELSIEGFDADLLVGHGTAPNQLCTTGVIEWLPNDGNVWGFDVYATCPGADGKLSTLHADVTGLAVK